MPPFRSGLLKRKVDSKHPKPTAGQLTKDLLEESDSLELINGQLDHEADDTDSEHEGEDVSDNEQDKVLFDDNADSTLGEDEDVENNDSVESSDLTDSEDTDEEDDTTEESGNSEEESSVDSGAESGPTQKQSGLSDSENEKEESRDKKNIVTDQRDKRKQGKADSAVAVQKLTDTIKNSSISQLQPVVQKDEYESGDTSDEEDRRNTVGAVPSWWYDEYPHVGYDLDGRRLARPPRPDLVDQFLRKCEDPDFWRTVRDPSTGQDIILSKQDLELIHRIRQGQVPDPNHDEYQPWVEWFSREVLQTPVRAFPDHKRSFLPSRSEQKQIGRIVHALKMGWTKTRRELAQERRKKREKNFYNLWGSATDEERARGIHKHIPAPRRALPSHAESYNPPPEYLLDARELKEWEALRETPWRRKWPFLPAAHASLRAVPAYARFARERFLRCLDLYLAPRAIAMRLTISPEDLVPKLPSPRDLQPFPTSEALVMRGHEGLVRSVDFDPAGQYLVSGGDDGTVRVWECGSGRCLRTLRVGAGGGEGEGVSRVAWIPVAGLTLVAAAVGAQLLLLNPGGHVGAHRAAAATDALLEEAPPAHDQRVDERTATAAQWARVAPEQWARGTRLLVTHFRPLTHVAWHARGDYLAVTLREAASRAVVVHQLSRRRSQLPFTRSKGLVQCALFHPTRPHLFVATQRVVRVYDLVRQELVRKLLTGAQWVSALAVHPQGDNLLVASYDRKCVWFDLELSSKPYQTLRLHGGAVRALAFHRRYPLFASAGDDDAIVVSHGMVYNDLLQNPLLVPLKQLRVGARAAHLCVLDVRFHPAQPWLAAACADGALRLFA